MSVLYSQAQKSKYRITLDITVQEDFNPQQIDWRKVLDLQGNESVQSYTESLSTPDRW